LSSARRTFTATGNSSFGYFGGGFTTSPIDLIDRIDYANDTATTSPKGPLSAARYGAAATGNSNFGYFGGGGPGSTSIVDRIDYSNDTATASLKGPLSRARRNLAATGNSSFGYFGGGISSPIFSTVDRIDYSNDTATAPAKGPLSLARYFLAASSLRANALPVSEAPTLNTPIQYIPFGYFGGGYPAVATVNRINFSNDTVTTSSKGPLVSARGFLAATGNKYYGYFGGGLANLSNPSIRSSIDRIDYLNDTATASPKGRLNTAVYSLSATGNSDFGYFGSGFFSYSPLLSVGGVQRIDYSSDTATAVTRTYLSSPNYLPQAATGNQDFGYFGGGAGGTPYATRSRVDRIDYSNDTASVSVRGSLSSARYSLAATGNSSFGYFGGGSPSPYKSTVDRIDYSNDTATASPKGPLSDARTYLAATGNSSFGYFGGGEDSSFNDTSSVDRIDYSNDTATASPKGPLSLARLGLAAVSSTNGLVY